MTSVRTLFLLIGCLFVALGFVGIFLPLIPTTPFLLLAAYFFSKSSPRFYEWLVSHPKLGPPVVAWRDHGVVRRKPKLIASAAMAISFFYVAFFRPTPVWLSAVIALSFGGILTFLWTRPEVARR